MAGTVLYANDEKADVAQDILSRAGPLCQEALDAGDWRQFKLLLRFLACLSPLYKEDGIAPILDELFNRAVDLQTASSEDVSEKEERRLENDTYDCSRSWALSSSRSSS